MARTFIAFEFLIPFWIPSIHFSTLRHTASSSIHPLWPRVFHLSSSGIVSRSSFNLHNQPGWNGSIWKMKIYLVFSTDKEHPWGTVINVREFWTKFLKKKKLSNFLTTKYNRIDVISVQCKLWNWRLFRIRELFLTRKVKISKFFYSTNVFPL